MNPLKECSIYILSLILFLIIFFSSTLTQSKDYDENNSWSIGDPIQVVMFCNYERDILEIAFAHSKSKEELNNLFIMKFIEGLCYRREPAGLYKIVEILGSYQDYNKVPTIILSASTLKGKEIIGYLVMAGTESTTKEKSI
tara:strand:+ start:86 stop:508 length:423 start_codon:yes stop_codon:yes gene_type:complete